MHAFAEYALVDPVRPYEILILYPRFSAFCSTKLHKINALAPSNLQKISAYFLRVKLRWISSLAAAIVTSVVLNHDVGLDVNDIRRRLRQIDTLHNANPVEQIRKRTS
ncbi:hypothetical protein MRB53_038551 [Persea americana]|nr:hypothetical protein MRB53_038551 [Persea americana]